MRFIQALPLMILLSLGAAGAAFAQASPADIAQEFVFLAGKGDVRALDLFRPGEAGDLREDFAEKAKELWGAPRGYESYSYPSVLAEIVRGDWAVVILRRSLVAGAASVEKEKKAYAAKIAKYFPADQQEAAKKLIFWEGNTFQTVLPLNLKRAKPGRPWLLLGKPGKGPTPAMRSAMIRLWQCNLLRWSDGEAGQEPVPFLYGEKIEDGPNERNPPVQCMNPFSGASCSDRDKVCRDTRGRPCKPQPESQSGKSTSSQ